MTYLRTALVSALLATTGLTGCAWLNVGEEEFNCSGMPGSAYCHSARDVYYATDDGSVPSRVAPEEAYNPDCEDCDRSEGDRFNGGKDAPEIVSRETIGAKQDPVVAAFVTPRLPDRPVPVRTPPVVMRIWIAPWVDTSDDLIAPGYVYTEIEPRRWIYQPAAARGTDTRFEPLAGSRRQNKAGKAPGVNTLEKLKESQRANNK